MAIYQRPDDIQEKLGVETEGDIRNLVFAAFGKDAKSSTKSEDLYEGTDLYVLGVRVDFTTAFESKDHMVEIPETMNLGLSTIRFGVRTGNDYHDFDEPVLVVCIDAGNNHMLKYMYQNILDEFKQNVRRIFEKGMDLYWDCVDNLVAQTA